MAPKVSHWQEARVVVVDAVVVWCFGLCRGEHRCGKKIRAFAEVCEARLVGQRS